MDHRSRYSCPPAVTLLGVAAVTGAAAIAVIAGVFLFDPIHRNTAEPYLMLLRAAVLGVSGGLLLRGLCWARTLFIAFGLPVFFLPVLFHPDPSLIGVLLFAALLCTRLFSRDANLFFTGRDDSRAHQHHRRDEERPRRGRYDY